MHELWGRNQRCLVINGQFISIEEMNMNNAIMEIITSRLGYRLSLDRLAEHTLGVKKSANGLQALQWYKEGRIDKIIEYCSKDVEITRDLFLFGVKNGFLLFKNKAGNAVRCPVDFL